MSEFFSALKADLLDRRLLPLVGLAGVALIAAIAYVVIGGGSSTPSSTPSIVAVPATTGIAATATTPEKAVAEVTSGSSEQRHGVSRDPFTLLPEAARQAAEAKKASTAGTTSNSNTANAGATSTAGSETSKSGSSSEKSTPTKKPAKPTKPKNVYHVAVLFGVIPAGVSPAGASLTPYENVKLLSPLPSAQQPLIVFRGVTAGGKSATFTLTSEAILHGTATCLPSPSQCEAIDVAPGQTEQLEYIAPSGEVSIYELRIVSIVSVKASTAAVRNLLHGTSKAGRELLRHEGLTDIPFLSNSTEAGVLIFAGHGAKAAKAHAAARTHHRA
jgi:hypothetical protein